MRYFYIILLKRGDYMAVDGNLVFETKIDVEGIIKGEKEISSKMINIKSKMLEVQNKAKALRAEMEKLADVPVNTRASETIEKKIESTKAKLKTAIEDFNRIEAGLSRRSTDSKGNFDYRAFEARQKIDTEYKAAAERVEKLNAQLKQYQHELENTRNAENQVTGKDTAAYREKQEALEQLELEYAGLTAKERETEQAEQSATNSTDRAKRSTADYKKHLQRTVTALKMFANGAARAGRALKSAFSHTAGKLISNIRGHFQKANNSTNVLEKSLRRIKNTLVRMFFFRLVHSPIDAIKDGLGEISKISPTLNKNLSALKTESTYLKNSFAALAAPLVNLVTPALTSFMQTISGVLTQTGKLIALLTGQSGFTQAVKVQQDYASSLDDTTESTDANTKAVKNNQKALAGYDELNVIDTSDQESASSGTSTPMFENVEAQAGGLASTLYDLFKNQDFEGIGKLIGEKINAALKNIKWEKIKSTLKTLASNIAGFLNGFIKSTDWNLVGSTIGEGINTAVNFARTFIKKFKWNELGKSVAKLINGVISTINWNEIGSTIGEGINAAISFTRTFLTTVKWNELGTSIAMLINSTFSTINWREVGLTISDAINAFFSTANGFFSTLNWTAMGTSIRTALVTAIENINWDEVKSTLVNGINGLVDLAVAFIGKPDFGDLGKKTAEGLKDVIRRINWDGIKEVFSTLLIGSLDFVDGFVLNINWKELGNKLSDDFEDFFAEGGDGRKAITISGKTIGDVCRSSMDLVNGFLEDKETADSFSGAVEEFFKSIPWVELIVKSITGGTELGTWIVQAATNLVEDFCEGLATAFGDSEDDPELSKAVKNFGISLINLLITAFESGLRILVNAIPNLLLGALKIVLGGLSWLLSIVFGDDWREQALSSMENWKADWSVNIPRVPYLATGTVVPANYGEFLAVLGDNKREAEVVSPVSAIKQAVLEAMAEGNFSDGSDKEINLYIDGEKLFSWIINKDSQYRKSHGYSAMRRAEV